MKKVFSIIILFTLFIAFTFPYYINAASLDTIKVDVSSAKVEPGKTVTVNITFGKELGSYTFDVAYDNNIFEYVSSEGGTANDNGSRVRIYYFDSAGGTNPRTSTSITFKAKSDITTSNPTDFSITAEGLANADASEQYDDITTPIDKSVLVEPKYENYKFELKYSGEVIINQEKEMNLILSSAMGKYYDKVRILATVAGPEGSTAKLLAIDSQSLEHDIVQSGWGEAEGYKIGGLVSQNLKVRGLFDKAGKYTITLKLIDRSDSDNVITTSSFNVDVKEKASSNNTNNVGNTDNTQSNNTQTNNNQNVNDKNEEVPETLPKTRTTKYAVVVPLTLRLIGAYMDLRKK